MEKFTYRNVVCISVPSVCATTKEMSDKRYSNTIGAWYITVKTDKYGNLETVKAIDDLHGLYIVFQISWLYIMKLANLMVQV